MNPYRIVSKRLNIFEKLIQSSYSQLFTFWIILNATFAALYFALSTYYPAHAPTIPPSLPTLYRFLDSCYFSIMTATTVGYGDMVPLGFSKFLVIIQSTSALLIFTVLVGKLVSQRQDTTLHEVHRMTFEGVFYHIRHVLFIVRKDFDTLIHKVKNGKELTDHDWETLGTAYLQAHSLIEEIPDLYSGHGFDLHNVDLNREKLLFEALHRTLTRIHVLLISMEQSGIDWTKHDISAKELRLLVDTVDGIAPLWMERSPFHEEQEFEDIRQLSERLHKQMKGK